MTRQRWHNDRLVEVGDDLPAGPPQPKPGLPRVLVARVREVVDRTIERHSDTALFVAIVGLMVSTVMFGLVVAAAISRAQEPAPAVVVCPPPLPHKKIDWVRLSSIPEDQKITAEDWNRVVEALDELRMSPGCREAMENDRARRP